MTARYSIISHTADTGIEATAGDLAGLMEDLAYGMFDLIYDVDSLPPAGVIRLEVGTRTPPDLVVDVLSELLYRSETHDVAYRDIAVSIGDDGAAIAAAACATAGAELKGPPIKAVTYHDLLVAEQPDGTWRGRVIFDV